MSLRLIEVILPQDFEGQVAELLTELDIVGAWEHGLHKELSLVRILVESEMAESVVHVIEHRFAHREGFRVMLIEVEATLPRPTKKKEAETEDTGAEKPKPPPDRVAVLELVEKLSDGSSITRTFLVTIVLSTIVAAVGLWRDNVAIIIGAMVIAPLLTPNMALALATTLGDASLIKRAIITNLGGLIFAFILSIGAGLMFAGNPATSEIIARASVSLGDIVLALAAGSAGALAFTTGVSAALVGVMVAVALLPPLVASGLLLGSGEAMMALNAFLLLMANIICVNLAAVATFIFQGIRPHAYWEGRRARRMVRRSLMLWLALLALLVFVILLSDTLFNA